MSGVPPAILPVPLSSAAAGFFVFSQPVVIASIQPAVFIAGCAASLAIGAGVAWWAGRARRLPASPVPAIPAPKPQDLVGLLVAQLPIPVWIVDGHGRITDMSLAGRETLGFGSDYAGKTFEAWIQPTETQTNWLDATQRALSGAVARESCSFVVAGTMRHGMRILIPLRGTGPSRAALGLLMEFPAEKKAPAQPTETDGRLAQFCRISPVPVIEWDPSGAVRTWNPAAELLFGYSLDVAMGRTANDLLIPNGQQVRYANAWTAVAEQRRAVNVVLQSRTKSGEILSCEWSSFPVLDSQQRVTSVVSFVKDVTEKPAQEHIPVEENDLGSLGRLATGVAQEFNSLLAPITTELDRLAREASESEYVLGHVRTLRTAVDRARELGERTQLIAQELPNTREWVDLNEVVISALANLRSAVDPRITLNTTLAPSLPQLPVSRAGAMELITQLVFQSRDAIAGTQAESSPPVENPAITVTTSRFEGVNPSAPRKGTANYQVIAVRDNGPGLTDEAKAHAFEPFFAPRSAVSRRGLGLHLAWRLARQHEGWVSLNSAPGQGCEVRVFIPEIPPKGSALAEGAAEVPLVASAPGKPRVLLVEDNLLVAHALSSVLCDSGFDVVFAENGERAWAMLDEEGAVVDVLLSDLNLPGMTGRDLLLKVQEKFSRIPFIVLSGHVGGAEASELITLGAIGTITKPVNPHELIDLVARASGRSV